MIWCGTFFGSFGSLLHNSKSDSNSSSPFATLLPAFTDVQGSQRIDFCIYIDPPAQATRAIQAMQHNDLDTLSLSINHTAYRLLWASPIAFGIKTKCSREGFIAVRTQLVIWMEAQ